MDWKQFFVEMVGNIIWPAVAIYALWNFQDSLRNAFSNLKSLKIKDLELKFEKLKRDAEEITGGQKTKFEEELSPELRSLEEQINEAVERIPAAAILLSWSELEDKLFKTVERLQISDKSPSARSTPYVIRALRHRGSLSQEYASLIRDMRSLRNDLIHKQVDLQYVTKDQARSYVDTSIELIHYLDSLKQVQTDSMQESETT